MINFIETKRVLTEPQKGLISAIRQQLEIINNEYNFSSNKFIVDTDLDQD